jgi:hypothetical protein
MKQRRKRLRFTLTLLFILALPEVVWKRTRWVSIPPRASLAWEWGEQ